MHFLIVTGQWMNSVHFASGSMFVMVVVMPVPINFMEITISGTTIAQAYIKSMNI